MLWIRLNALSIIGLRFHGYFIYIAKYQCGIAWTIINFTQTEHIHTATTTKKCEENPPTNFQLLFISVNSTQNRNDCAMNQIVWRNFQFTGKLNQIGGKFFKNCFLIFFSLFTWVNRWVWEKKYVVIICFRWAWNRFGDFSPLAKQMSQNENNLQHNWYCSEIIFFCSSPNMFSDLMNIPISTKSSWDFAFCDDDKMELFFFSRKI